jgi:hypothetical protein
VIDHFPGFIGGLVEFIEVVGYGLCAFLMLAMVVLVIMFLVAIIRGL